MGDTRQRTRWHPIEHLTEHPMKDETQRSINQTMSKVNVGSNLIKHQQLRPEQQMLRGIILLAQGLLDPRDKNQLGYPPRYQVTDLILAWSNKIKC